MRALAVVNPNATTIDFRSHDVVMSALRHLVDVDSVQTTHRGHAAELAAQARADGVDLVISVGGDGTINEIVNGLLRPPSAGGAQDGPVPDLALIPGGSTNVLARNVGVPENPVQAAGQLLDALRTGRRTSLSLGCLQGRYFTFSAGAGFDAAVVRSVEDLRDRGRRATVPLYVRSGLGAFYRQRERSGGPLTLTSVEPPLDGISVAIISNCSPWTYIGSRPVRPSPEADFSAGLDLVALTGLNARSILRHLYQMTRTQGPGVRGKHVLRLHDQDSITLTASTPVPVQVDGDYIGEHTELTFTSVPDALRLAC